MFCRIYTTGKNINENSLLDELSEVVGHPVVDNMYIQSEYYFICIRKNDEYNQENAKQFPDGFLYFELLIELEFEEAMMQVDIYEITGRVLKFLWSKSHSAVASCSFEEYLPNKGGYNSSEVPWI